MKPEQVLPAIIARARMSGREMSRRLGKPSTWVSKTIASKTCSRIDTLADVADVAGIDIALVDRKTDKIIGKVTPPRRSKGVAVQKGANS